MTLTELVREFEIWRKKKIKILCNNKGKKTTKTKKELQTVFMVLQDNKFVPLIQVTLELGVKKEQQTNEAEIKDRHVYSFKWINGSNVTEMSIFQSGFDAETCSVIIVSQKEQQSMTMTMIPSTIIWLMRSFKSANSIHLSFIMNSKCMGQIHWIAFVISFIRPY